jgi:hypothetical protein
VIRGIIVEIFPIVNDFTEGGSWEKFRTTLERFRTEIFRKLERFNGAKAHILKH